MNFEHLELVLVKYGSTNYCIGTTCIRRRGEVDQKELGSSVANFSSSWSSCKGACMYSSSNYAANNARCWFSLCIISTVSKLSILRTRSPRSSPYIFMARLELWWHLCGFSCVSLWPGISPLAAPVTRDRALWYRFWLLCREFSHCLDMIEWTNL